MEKLIRKFIKLLKSKPERPACYTDSGYLYCFCGKCKPEPMELPEDLKRLIYVETAKNVIKH